MLLFCQNFSNFSIIIVKFLTQLRFINTHRDVSVSYTHLDVYKRQIEQDIIEIKDELHVAVSQNLSSVAERVLYTRCLLYTSRCV